MRTSLVLLVVVVAAGLMPAVAPATPAATVSAGSLRARVSVAPWGISFTDGARAAGAHRGSGDGGRAWRHAGFRVNGGWRHATEVVAVRWKGPGYVAELATTDPQRRIEVRLVPDAEGVIALKARVLGSTADIEALGIGFRAEPGERYLGFGERSDTVGQAGATVENYVADGPYLPEERPAVSVVIPPWGFRGTDGDSYFPVPWLRTPGTTTGCATLSP